MPADFRLLLDSSPLMIWVCDTANRCVYFNRTWLQFTGRPLQAELGDGWLVGVHPEDRDSCVAADAHGFRTQLDFRLEYRLRHRDGSYRWILDQCTPRCDPRGGFIGYLGSCTDVTELRQAAADARLWQRRYDAALSASGWVAYERVRGRMEWSPTIQTLTGYPAQWLTDEPAWHNLVHPEDLERVREETGRVAHDTHAAAILYRVRHRNGHYLWLEDRGYCVASDEHIIGFVSDVTERRRNDEMLRRSEERFRLAAEAVDGIVYEIDIRSGAATRTGRLLHRLGYGAELADNAQAWTELMHPEDREQCGAGYALLMGAGIDTAQMEYRLRDVRGNYHHVLDRALIMRNALGEPERMVGCSLDITALKQAEQEILELNARLEQRVADRTAALQAANQELEAFTYSVSHDLRAPLRHVAGFTDLLRSRLGELDPQAQRYLETITGATTRMAEMIDKLLALSRVGRGEMRLVEVDVGALVQEVREELASFVNGRNIHWRIGSLPVVLADRALLHGAMENLLSNALKFTAGRNPAVIEISACDGAREHEIVVRDNGAGFDMKYVAKLFGVFQRLHAPGEFDGTGIGLASVRRIISRHGGRVWAKGSPGAGAEFHFTLPAREQP